MAQVAIPLVVPCLCQHHELARERLQLSISAARFSAFPTLDCPREIYLAALRHPGVQFENTIFTSRHTGGVALRYSLCFLALYGCQTAAVRVNPWLLKKSRAKYTRLPLCFDSGALSLSPEPPPAQIYEVHFSVHPHLNVTFERSSKTKPSPPQGAALRPL